MKKQPKQYSRLLMALCLCFGFALSAHAQQNQKIIFPTPDGFESSQGSFIRPVSTGGYILLGLANYIEGSAGYSLPRAIKVNAELETEWDNTYLDPSNSPNGIYTELYSAPLELSDGSFVFGMVDTSSGFDLMRLAPTGELLWGKDLPGWLNYVNPLGALPNGHFLATRSHLPGQSGWVNSVLQFDINGEVVEQHVIEEVPFIHASIRLSGGDIVTVNAAQSARTFTRVDAMSNVIWQTAPLTGLSNLLSPMPDGGFGVVGNQSAGIFRIHFFNDQGVETGQTPELQLPINQIFSLDFYADGSFLIAGRTIFSKGFLARYQQDGTLIWSAESPMDGQEDLRYLSGCATPDGWGAGTGGTSTPFMGLLRVSENSGIFFNTLTGRVGKDDDDDCLLSDTEVNIQNARIRANNGVNEFFAFSDADGNYELLLPPGDFTLSIETNEPFFSICPTTDLSLSFPGGANGAATLDFPMQTLQPIHQIKGTLWLDQNDNCTADPEDIRLPQWRVRINYENGNSLVFMFTDVNGNYSYFVPSGNYSVVAMPYNQNFSICDPNPQTVTLTGSDPQVATVNFTAQGHTDCAQLRTDIQATTIRPCVNRTIYVSYRNDGAVTANNAALEVILPPGLTYVTATPAPATVDGNALFFNLGDVPPSPGNIWMRVEIIVSADCDLQIGDQVCVTANISPAEMCGEAPDWNGAIVAITEGVCEGDNAVFTIKNIGSAPNIIPRNYIVIVEDQIVLLQGQFQLNPAEEHIVQVPVPVDPSTIVIEAQQEPGFPGDTSVTFSLANCVGMGGLPTGFSSNAGPFSDNDCFFVVNSYDPNDKLATPLGYSEEHIVRPGTPLEYTIRFQNTGNDTAYVVVIRDTLSQHLDFRRVEVMGASHSYDFAQLNDSTLQFKFDNILLPDSTTNLAASQGFVEFRIYPKADLPNGTIVDNRAAIYFDFNAPVMTNTVRRKYESLTLVETDERSNPQQLAVQVFPNPFSNQATFELPEDAPTGRYVLDLYDSAARQLQSLPFDDRRCIVTRAALPKGLLFWKIAREGHTVASGKMIAD